MYILFRAIFNVGVCKTIIISDCRTPTRKDASGGVRDPVQPSQNPVLESVAGAHPAGLVTALYPPLAANKAGKASPLIKGRLRKQRLLAVPNCHLVSPSLVTGGPGVWSAVLVC